MQTDYKIFEIYELASTLRAHRAAGRVIVQAHGVFDVLHLGHIAYLDLARQLGDVLVVTVTSDAFVNKGPGRPVFSDTLRACALAALQSVDFVAINYDPTGVPAIKLLRPNIWARGAEYRGFIESGKDLSGAQRLELDAVKAVGGEVRYTEGVVYSSTDLVQRFLAGVDHRG